MEIITRKIKDLEPADYNPRQASEKQYKDLKESIEKFGVVDPIIVNKRNNKIVGGHFRIKVLKDLGKTEIPTIEVDLDEKEEKELNIRLNKNTGDWDWDLLAGFDIDILQDVGFENLDRFKGDIVGDPRKEWIDMPEFTKKYEGSIRDIIIHFKTEEDVKKFADLLQQNITEKTKFLWYPYVKPTEQENKAYK